MMAQLGDNTTADRQFRRSAVLLEGMMKLPTHFSPLLTSAMLSLIMMACAGEPPTVPVTANSRVPAAGTRAVANDKAMVCHMTDEDPRIIEISTAALTAHLNHGDHIAQFIVDKTRDDLGDGIHFDRIGDAIAAARAVRMARGEQALGACRITIVVAPGIYPGSVAASADPAFERFPLIIDVPDVTIQGAFDMQLDASGRATEASGNGNTTILAPSPALVSVLNFSEPLFFVNGQVDGFSGNGVVVQGFELQSGHPGVDAQIGGAGIVSLRVSGLVVQGNRFDDRFSESVDLRASSAHVDNNHFGNGGALPTLGGTCDLCLAGPGDYEAQGNRFLAGGIPGILVTPVAGLKVPGGVEAYVLPATATVNATLVNNEVRDHQRLPVGVGIRVGAIGVGAPNVAGLTHVDAHDNVLVNNRFAMIVEAAFPMPNTLRKGDIELTLHGNTFLASCENNFLVSFSRHTTGLGLPNANAPYLLSSSYSLTLGGDIAWDDIWYSHPAGFGNTFTVDGAVIPNGSRNAYDGTRICS
jgi:hypothetical protein